MATNCISVVLPLSACTPGVLTAPSIVTRWLLNSFMETVTYGDATEVNPHMNPTQKTTPPKNGLRPLRVHATIPMRLATTKGSLTHQFRRTVARVVHAYDSFGDGEPSARLSE